MNNIDIFMKNYLKELSISVDRVQLTQCSPSWRSYNYTPSFSSIGFICSGEGWMKIDNADLYPKEGQLYLLPSGTQQSFSTINDNPYRKYYCHFHAAAGSVSIFDAIKLPLCIYVADKQQVIAIFQELLESFNKSDVISLLKVKSMMLKLILYYIESCNLEHIQLLNKDLNIHIKKAVNYIEANLKEEINIEKIAEITGYHPCYFIKLFKDTFGLAPVQYITKRRIEKSVFLLTNSSLTISEIAEEIGFNSQFYFSNIFKKHTGLSPTEYRSAYQSKS